MRPRCSILTGGFDFSGCGDFTSCPPVERAAMSNSDPSVIVLHGIPCIDGLYISFDSNREIGSLKVRRDSPFFFWRDRFSREHGQHAYRAVSDAERVASEASQSEERFTRKSNASHDAVQAGSDGAKGTFPDGQACRHEIA